MTKTTGENSMKINNITDLPGLVWRRSSRCLYNGNCAEVATTSISERLAAAEAAARAAERQQILERIGNAEYLAPCDGRCPHIRPGNPFHGNKHLHPVAELLEVP